MNIIDQCNNYLRILIKYMSVRREILHNVFKVEIFWVVTL